MEEKKNTRQRGQVKDLGRGSYRIAISLGTRPDGSRPYHNETMHNTTEPKALKRVTMILAQVDAGTYFVADKQSLKELLVEWIDRLRRRGLKRSTLEAYETQIENHIAAIGVKKREEDESEPALGQIPIARLTTDTLQKFFDALQDKGYKPSFLRTLALRIKPALQFAKTRGRIQDNPMDLVELPPIGKVKKARIFNEEEALDFIEAARRVPEDIMFIFVLLTGLRPSEFFGVEYPDLSVVKEGEHERGRVRITKQAWRPRGGGWYFDTPKTPSSVRSIYFPASLYYELMAHKAEKLLKLKALMQKHQLVFTNERGEPFTRGSAHRRFHRVCLRAFLDTEGRSLYTLRRSHATLSLLAGENMKSLSERMGHVSVEFTQDEYMDVLPAMQQLAADRLENSLLRRNLAETGNDHAM
jgi:integrase